jgi:hypothetical protein
MPRYNVNYKNKWACFSSIVDGFITKFTDKSDYEEWRKSEYRIDYRPVEQCNLKTMEDAVFSIRLNRTHNEAIKHLIECGLEHEESEKLIYDIETECWCPILKENGKYECPNCGSEVERGQGVCNEGSCELEFMWREQKEDLE